MKILRALVWKQFSTTFNNPAVLLMMVGMPFFVVLLIQLAFGDLVWGRGIPDEIVPVGLVNQDRGSEWGNAGQIITQSLLGINLNQTADESLGKLFEVQEIFDPVRARQMVERGELVGALLIPVDFSTNLAGSHATLDVVIYDRYIFRGEAFRNLVDMLASLLSNSEISVRGAVEGVAWDPPTRNRLEAGEYARSLETLAARAGEIQAYPIRIRQLPSQSPKPQVSLTRSLAAGIVVLFSGFWGLLGASALHQEKTMGTMRRMFLTPNPPGLIILGTIVSVFSSCLLQLGLVAAGLALGEWLAAPTRALVPLDLAGLGFWILALAGTSAGFGVLAAGLAHSYTQAANYGRGILILMALVGGVFFPVDPVTGPLRLLAPLTFHYWALQGYQELLSGAGPAELWLQLLILLGMGLTYFGLGSWLLRKRLVFAG